MEKLSFHKIEGSIMVMVFKKGISVDLSLAKELVQERLTFYNGHSYPTLADIRQIKLFTREALVYMGKGEAIKNMRAGAILMGDYSTVLIANLFIRFGKPAIPTKAFRTREQAIKWLRQFVVIKNES